MNKKEYSEYLKNPKWQKKRLEILSRDNFSCVVCGKGIETDTALHVHHLSYIKGRMPWECRGSNNQETFFFLKIVKIFGHKKIKL